MIGNVEFAKETQGIWVKDSMNVMITCLYKRDLSFSHCNHVDSYIEARIIFDGKSSNMVVAAVDLQKKKKSLKNLEDYSFSNCLVSCCLLLSNSLF